MTNAMTTYAILTRPHAADWMWKEAIAATTSPGMWTVYILIEGCIISHVILPSAQDMRDYIEEIVEDEDNETEYTYKVVWTM